MTDDALAKLLLGISTELTLEQAEIGAAEVRRYFREELPKPKESPWGAFNVDWNMGYNACLADVQRRLGL